MSPEEILAAIRHPVGAFPEEAFQEALKRSDEMRPLLLEEFKKSWQRGLAGESLDDKFGHCYALFLLANEGCQELFPLIVECLSSSDDTLLDNAFGDVWTEHFPEFLMATFNGDVESLFRIVRDSSLDEHQRSIACKALVELCATGKIKRSPVVELMLAQLDDDDNPGFLRETMAYHLQDLCPIESEGLLRETGLFTDAEIDEHLALGIDGCLKHYKNFHRIGDLTDSMRHFRTWAFVKPAKEVKSKPAPNILHAAPVKASEKAKTPAFQPPPPPKPKAPVNQDERLISRNGPCPCGSGKIYKKCCAKN